MRSQKLVASIFAAGTFLFMASSGIMAQNLDTRHMEHEKAATNFMDMLYLNPSYQVGRYSSSLNRADFYYNDRHATQPPLLESGNETNLWGGRIDAYIIKGKSTIWGYAHYDNGRIQNVRYSETSDASLLYPYLIADTIGGGVSKDEIYDFMGGFATRLGSRWIIGGQGTYTAQLDYRTRDPRPKNLTSDIKLVIGSSYLLNNYKLGASFDFHRYKQTNVVKIYNEVSSPVFYHLTGLGTDYYRFRGENTETYYKGVGWGFMLNVAPKDKSGFFVSYKYQNLFIDKIISTLNELPMSTLKLYSFSSEAGYLRQGRSHDFGVKVDENYRLRKGIENIFGSPASNMYPQIARMPQYKQQQLNLSVESFYGYHPLHTVYEFGYRFGYENLRETYNEPAQVIRSSSVSSRFHFKGLRQIRQFLLQFRTSFLLTNAFKNKIQLSAETNRPMLPPLLQRYSYLSSSRYLIDNNIELHYDTGHKYSLFMALNWQYSHYLEHQHTHEERISIGIEF